jgi:FMN reductase
MPTVPGAAPATPTPAAPRVLVLSTSLHPHSRSRALAAHARGVLSRLGARTDWLDCRALPLPYMDGDTAHAHEATGALRAAIAQADAVVLATGIYNYDASAVAKACLELGGRAWNDKVVALLSASGSLTSCMAPMGIASSLMLDFRCVIVPVFPVATAAAFAGEELTDPECVKRTLLACERLMALCAVARPRP